MYLPELRGCTAALILLLAGCTTDPLAPSLGRAPDPVSIASLDLIVEPDGAGLPEGSGNAVEGRIVYNNRCQACHGASGEGANPSLQLVGGDMHSSGAPLRTVGSFWPYATTIYDYIRRAMPADAPKSLSDNEVYQVTAYLLFLNGIVGEETVLDRVSLPAVMMPNRNGFIDNSKLR